MIAAIAVCVAEQHFLHKGQALCKSGKRRRRCESMQGDLGSRFNALGGRQIRRGMHATHMCFAKKNVLQDM